MANFVQSVAEDTWR